MPKLTRPWSSSAPSVNVFSTVPCAECAKEAPFDEDAWDRAQEAPFDEDAWQEPYVAERLQGVLEAEHYHKLLGSGLTDDTIVRMEVFTEWDNIERLVMLGNNVARGPILIFPFFDRGGKRVEYRVARGFPHFIRPDGTVAKYLIPADSGNRAYFPPFQCVWDALKKPGQSVLITEGILKACAAAQEGVPAIGLMGLWGWVVGRSNPRRLIDSLADIKWRGRSVLLVADFDPMRKPTVNHGAAELARVLTEQGASCFISWLPPGPRGWDGLPTKQALDDYLDRNGAEKMCIWVQAQTAGRRALRVEECREEMARHRDDSLRVRGAVCLDAGPTGIGKSHADAASLGRAKMEVVMQAALMQEGLAKELLLDMQPRSLLLTNTHVQCADAVEMLKRNGLDAVAYPRLDGGSCVRNDEAQAVMERGLPVTKVLCPDCLHRPSCPYWGQFEAAKIARNAVATHARGAASMQDMMEARTVLSLHESPLDCLRPTFVTKNGLPAVELVARQAEGDAAGAPERAFFRRLASVAKELDGWLNGSNITEDVPLPTPCAHEPPNLYRDLNEACQKLGASPPQEAMRIALAAVLGRLSLIAVVVDERPDGKGAKEDGGGKAAVKTKVVRKLVGVCNTDLPADITVWLNDATALPSELQNVLGRPVNDITPQGEFSMHAPVVQIVPDKDVTKARKATSVLPLLRGLMHDLPHQRVGLLTHQKLAEALPRLLEEPYRERLAKASYFGSGLSRGSNEWFRDCDALVVLGTPRVGADAVRMHLLRLGNVRAAKLQRQGAEWACDWWSGVTESGRRVTVKTHHYTNHDWHSAYCSLVRSELVQAVGRGRGILPEGIPVYVVSRENLAPPDRQDGRNGYRLSDHPFAPLTTVQAKVLDALGAGAVRRSPEIATAAGVSRRRASKVLAELERAGRVRRVGQRGGWVR